MKLSVILTIIFLSHNLYAETKEIENSSCFKIGEKWHDILLPNGATNVRWLFGDDKSNLPFMSITFNLDDESFDVWAKKCGVKFKKSGKVNWWAKEIEEGGGFVSVNKYPSNRYCIGVERTSVPEASKSVNGKPYFGCPISEPIDY